MKKSRICAPTVLNEATHYPCPSTFSRGMRVEVGEVALLFLSGTASIGPNGETLHVGDFDAQAGRVFCNLQALLAAERATWSDVVKTTVFLRDMSDYGRFNRVRTQYFRRYGLLACPPASTCVQARLCRDELLVEMEAIAVVSSSEHAD